MMQVALLLSAVCALAGVGASASAPSGQLYLSSGPSHPLAPLSAPQANAVIAHHLGVAQFEHLPADNANDKSWMAALAGQWTHQVGPKLVILLECGQQGCDHAVPESLGSPLALPALPLRSWIALLTLHLHRLAGSLALDTANPARVWGLDTLVTALKSVDGWAGWVGHELGNAIGWHQIDKTLKASAEPVRTNYRLLTDLDFVDKSSDLLLADLESLTALVDSFALSESDDSHAQRSTPHIVALHLKGIKAVSDKHSPTSPEYERAATLLRSTLAATMAAFAHASPSNPTVLVLALPPYSPPLLRKRTAWLKPFASLSKRYSTRPSPRSALTKRDVDDSEGRIQQRVARPTPSPVVPSGYVCFESEADLRNQTLACLDRGTAVKGVTVKGTECWVCSCGKTTEAGKTKSWAGQGCEKEDLSSDFVLLFFSGAGLLIVLLVSVMLLASVGNAELPGTLASVGGGMGVGGKRD